MLANSIGHLDIQLLFSTGRKTAESSLVTDDVLVTSSEPDWANMKSITETNFSVSELKTFDTDHDILPYIQSLIRQIPSLLGKPVDNDKEIESNSDEEKEEEDEGAKESDDLEGISVKNVFVQSLLEDADSFIQKWNETASSVVNNLLVSENGKENYWNDFLEGEHLVSLDEKGHLQLVCAQKWFGKNSTDPESVSNPKKVLKSINFVSYEWKTVENSSFEWPGGQVCCQDCTFIGGNFGKGGFKPTGAGYYWIDHFCVPCSSSSTEVSTRKMKLFALTHVCSRIMITDLHLLERNAVKLIKYWFAKKESPAEQQHLISDISPEHLGKIIWDEIAADSFNSLMILDPTNSSAPALLFSDENPSFTSNIAAVRSFPLQKLEEILPLVTCSYEATLTKLLFGSCLSSSEHQEQQRTQKRFIFNPSSKMENEGNDPTRLFISCLADLLVAVFHSGNESNKNVFGLIYSSQWFDLRHIILPFLFAACESQDYLLDGRDHDPFPLKGFSWFPPFKLHHSNNNDNDDDKEEGETNDNGIMVSMQFHENLPSQLISISRIIHVVDGLQPLITALSIRGFTAALKEKYDIRQCFPFLVSYGFTPRGENCMIEVAFCLEHVEGYWRIFPSKLIWVLKVNHFQHEPTDKEKDRVAFNVLQVNLEKWESLSKVILPAENNNKKSSGFPELIELETDIPLSKDGEIVIVTTMRNHFWQESDTPWKNVHRWAEKLGCRDAPHTNCPLLQ
jgi:hypothetical protein